MDCHKKLIDTLTKALDTNFKKEDKDRMITILESSISSVKDIAHSRKTPKEYENIRRSLSLPYSKNINLTDFVFDDKKKIVNKLSPINSGKIIVPTQDGNKQFTYKNMSILLAIAKAKIVGDKESLNKLLLLNKEKLDWVNGNTYNILNTKWRGKANVPFNVALQEISSGIRNINDKTRQNWDKLKNDILKNRLTKFYDAKDQNGNYINIVDRSILFSTGNEQINIDNSVIEYELIPTFKKTIIEIRKTLSEEDKITKDNIGEKFNVKSRHEEGKNVDHTGGAYGGDSIWAGLIRSAGVKINHYIPLSFSPSRRNKDLMKLNDKIIKVTQNETEAGNALNTLLGNNTHDMNNRNFVQVYNADTIIAVAPIIDGKVDGGTGSAIRTAEFLEKDIYILNTEDAKWYKPSNGRYIVTENPPSFKGNIAAIGTRRIESYKTKGKDGTFIDTKVFDNNDAILNEMQDAVNKSFNLNSIQTQEVKKQDPTKYPLVNTVDVGDNKTEQTISKTLIKTILLKAIEKKPVQFQLKIWMNLL